MTEQGNNPEGSSINDTVKGSEIYSLLVSLVIHSEQARWTRVNTLIAIDAFLFLAWIGLFEGLPAFPYKEYLLLALCVPGILLGIFFGQLGWRTSDYLEHIGPKEGNPGTALESPRPRFSGWIAQVVAP